MKRKRIFTWLLLLLLLGGAFVGLWRSRESVATPSLFTDLPASEMPASFPEHIVAKRHRWVRLDQLGMSQLSLKPGEEKRVVLNLFPDLEVEATVMANKTHYNQDQSAFGLIEDDPDSVLVMSFHKNVMMGVAVLPDARQVLISHVVDGKYVVVEVDSGKLGRCGTCVEMLPDNLGLPKKEGKAKASVEGTKQTKTSAAPRSTWSRRLAMADSEASKETTVECHECQEDTPGSRIRPLLAALGAPASLLAAGGYSGTMHGPGGSVRQTMGPTTPGAIQFQKSGDMEYLDVLFIYENNLLVQEAGNPPDLVVGLANLQTKVTRMVDLTNAIFTACSVPIEVRQAALVAGRYRVPAEPQGTNLWWSGYGGPAWEEIQAPVQPDSTPTDPKGWTVWSPTGTQKQAKVGVYQPLYEDLSDRPNAGIMDYLGWIVDRGTFSSANLLYGDQYWGDDTFGNEFSGGTVAESPEPYVNHPEGTLWRLEPQDKQNKQKAIYREGPDPGAAGAGSLGNPTLFTGPVDHPESMALIVAEPGMTDSAHDFRVYRYDHGGNSTIYGTDYNGTYTGVLGLRMDLNNTDYGGAFMTGPPMLWTGAARYPLMHGETGPFNFVDITTEQPSGTGISSTSGFNPMAAKADARADIVCVLASDGIGPGGVMGVAYKYSNLTPIANPSIGVGRGPNPQPNDIHRSIYSHVLSNGTFSAHEGELISGVSTPYTGGFVGGDLDPNRVINSTTSSLAAYYSFSNSPDDISTNDGTEMGGWKYGADRNNAPNRAGNATSGHVQVTDDPSLDLPNGFSFGAWVYWDSLAGTQTILSKAGEFKLEVMNNGSELWVELYDGSAPDPYRGRSTAVNFKTHTWYLVYFAYDNVADQKDLYVNGFAVGCNDQVGTFVGPLLAAGNNLLMGADAGPSNYVQGLVDEVRIYRIGLSAAQILDLYQVERAPPTFDSNQGLVAYYPFTDGGLTDSSTEGNDATSAGAPLAVSDRHGSLGADDAYQLSAGNNINTQTSNGFPWWPSSPIPDPSVSNADFTLSLWLAKPAGGSFGGNNRAIVANQSPRQFQLEVGDNNWLRFYTGFAAGGPDCQVNLTWSPSTWYHVVVTRVGNQLKIYRDGLLRATSTTTDVNMATVAEAFLTFGEDPSSPGRELDGSIDDVRLYDHGINDLDVQDLYLQERAAMSGPIFDLTAGLTVHYPISASPPFNDTTSQVRDVVSMTFSTVSGPATLEEGRYGAQDANGSYPFGGADFINMGKTMPNICDGPFTISFWANATALPAPGNTFDIMGNRDIAPDPANSWWISVNDAGAITFNADDGMNPVAVATSGTGALVVNTWRHIVITRSAGRRVNIYVNGISPGGPEDTGPGPDIPNALDDLYAGRAGPLGASGFQGKLDEIRIYENTELLPWQADVLFNAEDVNIVGSATIKINFGLSDPSDFGDSVLLELFANTPTGVPFHSMDYNASGSSIVHSFSAASQAGAWQDRQGVWRITCLSGSVFISSVEITVNGESFVYYGNITPPHTLAPSSFESHLHMNRDTWSAMVVRLNHGITGYTFPHELGHVLGLNHGNGDDQGQGPLTGEEPEVVFNPHGHISVQGGVRTGNGNFVRDEFLSMGNHFMAFGTQAGGGYYGQPGGTGTFGLYSTIMAYTFDSGNPNKYAKVPRFASPNVTYKGGITGDNHGRMLPPPQGRYDRPLYFDAVRTLRVVGQGATFYRDDNGSGRLEASWSVPTRPITSVPDPGGVTDKKPDSDTTVARAGDPGGSGSADVARAKGGSSPVPDPNSGRANPARGDDSPRVTLAQGSGLPGKSGGGGIGGSTGIPTEPEQPSRPEPGKPPPVEPGPKRPKPIPRPIPGKRTNFGGKTGVSVPNDSRRHSLPLVLRRMADRSYGVSINGHNLGATGGEDAAASTDDGRRAFHGRSVWWHAVVPAAGVYDLQADTRGSGIDTTLGVWLEDNDKLESLGVNDNDPRRTGPASAVRRRGVTLRKGQKVLFGLDGVNGAQGRVRLNVRLKPVR